ncbi:MAG: hypothetical protein J0L57_11190 [Burkholderiales bacterium]|nr:hypothetical protein [Burkholderiales bacterium]
MADLATDTAHWPSPPFPWDHQTVDENALQPCRLRLRGGRDIDGDLCRFEPIAHRLRFRPSGASAPMAVPFAQIRVCTLVQPLLPLPHAGRLPAPEHERGYRIESFDGTHLVGSTVGRVEASYGLFLFPPVDVDRSVQRVFIPEDAYRHANFGATALEKAAAAWITTPQDLLAAIGRQQTAPVLRAGVAIANLGLATDRQIERALAAQAQTPDRALGEILVASGVVAQPDLDAALAHKLGYPLVDIDRFPIDLRAVGRLPLATLNSLQALPLLLDGDRIVLAVASPSRESGLRTLRLTTGLTPVAVLARRSALIRRLTELAERDVWKEAGQAKRMPLP